MSDPVFLVTGASTGIGAATARAAFVVSQPAHVDINEVLVRPTQQST